jgi:hypothetical protein
LGVPMWRQSLMPSAPSIRVPGLPHNFDAKLAARPLTMPYNTLGLTVQHRSIARIRQQYGLCNPHCLHRDDNGPIDGNGSLCHGS